MATARLACTRARRSEYLTVEVTTHGETLGMREHKKVPVSMLVACCRNDRDVIYFMMLVTVCCADQSLLRSSDHDASDARVEPLSIELWGAA
jgi:hypothetical protein